MPQQVLLDFTEHINSQYLRNLCFSVYTGCRRIINQKIPGRTLTGFGPASIAEKILRSQSVGALTSTKVYTPTFIIAPSLGQPVTDSWTETPEKSGVLLCAYCLSEDQRWLLGSVTDSCGELLETCCINIDVPNRSQRKKAVVRRTGLLKLWEFLIGVMSGTTTPWRIVIGRFGRLGHGELKGKNPLLYLDFVKIHPQYQMNFGTFLIGLVPIISSLIQTKLRRWFFIDLASIAKHFPRLLMVSHEWPRWTCLGSTFRATCPFRDQVDHLVRQSAQTMYALRILRHHGLCGPPLWEVAGATLMSRLTYASSAWWGFIDAEGRKRLNSVVTKATKYGYLPPSPAFFWWYLHEDRPKVF